MVFKLSTEVANKLRAVRKGEHGLGLAIEEALGQGLTSLAYGPTVRLSGDANGLNKFMKVYRFVATIDILR